ncbi:MAG: signal peptidase I [Anaerolineae bacterium]
MEELTEQPLTEAADPVEPEQKQALRQFKSIALEVLETAALAVLIWLVLNTATARYVVEGVSMQPNLQTGQYFIVSRVAYWFNDPQRGDVIVFDYPNNPDDDYVKRIIGLPGETVRIDVNGQVFIDEAPLNEEYINGGRAGRAGSWTVPPGSYFVMGDTRGSSSDSRSWGALEESYIIGKAWLSYWPVDMWGTAPHHTFSD